MWIISYLKKLLLTLFIKIKFNHLLNLLSVNTSSLNKDLLVLLASNEKFILKFLYKCCDINKINEAIL